MTIDSDWKCDICEIPIKVWYNSRHTCTRHIELKETLLRRWINFLDELAKLPKERHLFHISRLLRNNIITDLLEKLFSEDELTQLTKFDKKSDIFKIELEKWV